ncbi:MAG: hypothetical protein FRX49_11375 [Trebouxia sp. A1-2]|nr:MAG: hypothetical protein FRX49_11375 [Trebouxia sp. A1-2]
MGAKAAVAMGCPVMSRLGVGSWLAPSTRAATTSSPLPTWDTPSHPAQINTKAECRNASGDSKTCDMSTSAAELRKAGRRVRVRASTNCTWSCSSRKAAGAKAAWGRASSRNASSSSVAAKLSQALMGSARQPDLCQQEYSRRRGGCRGGCLQPGGLPGLPGPAALPGQAGQGTAPSLHPAPTSLHSVPILLTLQGDRNAMPTGSTGFTSKYSHTLPCMTRRAIQGQQQLMVKRKADNEQKLRLVTNRSPNRKVVGQLGIQDMQSTQMQHLGGILGVNMLQQET